MRTIDDLWDGYRRFRTGRYSEQARLYETLAHGQDPKIFLVGCSDSRADPSDIFDTAPGELFTVRNVANLVPPYEPDGQLHGTSAALEYAVLRLGVKHIVVMGHAKCGGIGACLASKSAEPFGQFVAPWVALLDEARDRVLAGKPEDPQHALEIEGVKHSLQNLMTFPFVRAAVQAGELALHGAWFEIASGKLSWLHHNGGTIEEVPQ